MKKTYQLLLSIVLVTINFVSYAAREHINSPSARQPRFKADKALKKAIQTETEIYRTKKYLDFKTSTKLQPKKNKRPVRSLIFAERVKTEGL